MGWSKVVHFHYFDYWLLQLLVQYRLRQLYSLIVTTTVNVCYLCYDVILNRNRPIVAQAISAISPRIFVLSGAIAAHPFDFCHATCVHYATHVHIAVYIMYGVSVRSSVCRAHAGVISKSAITQSTLCDSSMEF